MATVTRILSNAGDPITAPDGTVKAAAAINFQLVDAAKRQPCSLFDAVTGEYIVGSVVTDTTDGVGHFSTSLWPNNRGEYATFYKVTLPGTTIKPFYIRIAEGEGDISLVEAKANMEALQPQTLSLFEALLASLTALAGQVTAVVTTTTNGLMSYVDKNRLNFLVGLGVNALDYPTLADADEAAFALDRELVISTQWDVVPATLNADLRVVMGGKLNNAGPVSITGKFKASRDLVFVGAGTVTLADVECAYPEWFGYSDTENAAFINKALRAVNGKAPVSLAGRTYNTIQSVLLLKDDRVSGLAAALSHIRCAGSAGAAVYPLTTNVANLGADPYFYNITLENFTVTGGVGADAHTPDRVINLDHVGQSNIRNVKVFNGKRGVYITYGYYNNFERVKVYGASLSGLYITYGPQYATTTQVFDKCYFSGHSSNPMQNGIVLAASVVGVAGNVLGTIFNDCVIESTTSSAVVVGRGADVAFTKLYTENCVMDPLSTDPVIDLWNTGTYAAFDYNNRATFVGAGTLNGSSSANPQSVGFKLGYVQSLGINGLFAGRILDLFQIVNPANIPQGSIYLGGDNVLSPNRAFVQDAATYTEMLYTTPRILGYAPIAWNSLTRDRVHNTPHAFAVAADEPTTAPGAAGQLNITRSGKIYVANGTASSANWLLAASISQTGKLTLYGSQLFVPANSSLTAIANDAPFNIQGVNFTSAGTMLLLCTGTWSNTLGTSRTVSIAPIYNQAASTAGSVDIIVNRTETALGSGVHKFLDFQVGGATKYAVSNKGHQFSNVGTPVASAGAITPSGPIFHVTGAAVVNTINLPHEGFVGRITIIPDAAFTTVTSGNIAIASTAVIGKALDFTFDGTKWHPSY